MITPNYWITKEHSCPICFKGKFIDKLVKVGKRVTTCVGCRHVGIPIKITDVK